MAFFCVSGCSSWFPGILGTEVVGVWDGSCRCCFMALLYLAIKPAQVGVNVDGLACSLHCPTDCSCQTRGQGLLPGVVLSHSYRGQQCLPRGCETPRLGYWVEY
jgi:hypothetical protein